MYSQPVYKSYLQSKNAPADQQQYIVTTDHNVCTSEPKANEYHIVYIDLTKPDYTSYTKL